MNNKSKILICINNIYSLLIIYYLLTSIYNLPMLPFFACDTNPHNYALVFLLLNIPYIIYSLSIIYNSIKKRGIHVLIALSIVIGYSYSIINTILIIKGHNDLINNLYFAYPSLLVYSYILSKSSIDFKIISKPVINYFMMVSIISLIILVCYLELGQSFFKSINVFIITLTIMYPFTLPLIFSIPLKLSQKKCRKNNLLINNELLYKAKDAQTIIVKKKKEKTYVLDNINNYSKYTDEELLSIISSIEKACPNKFSVAFKNEKSELIIKEPKEIPELGISGKLKRTIISIGNEMLLTKKKIKNKYKKNITRLNKDNCKLLYVIEKKEIIAIMTIKEIINIDNKITNELKKLNKKVVYLEKEREIDEYIMQSKDNNEKVIVYIQENTSVLSTLINISNRLQKIIKQNLVLSFMINLINIPIIMGMFKIFNNNMNALYPLIVSIISLLIVILNSLRLKTGE